MNKFTLVKKEKPLILHSYLNINNPLVAFNVYRGVLMPPHLVLKEGAPISFWMLSRLLQKNKTQKVNEFRLEKFRLQNFPNSVSRLKCLYAFENIEDATSASRLWESKYFSEKYLSEIGFAPESKRSKVDSNWITDFFPADRLINDVDRDWMSKYWSGVSIPEKEPLWEILIDAPGMVYGTDLRESSWKIIEKNQPESLPFAELSRLAAEVNSDVGIIIPVLLRSNNSENEIEVNYVCNMADYLNQTLDEKLKGHNFSVRVPMANLKVPDLQKYKQKLKISELIDL